MQVTLFHQDFGLDEEKKTMELQEKTLEYLTTNIKNNLDLNDISEINEAYQCTSKLDCSFLVKQYFIATNLTLISFLSLLWLLFYDNPLTISVQILFISI